MLIDTSEKTAFSRVGTPEEHDQLRTPRTIDPVTDERVESHAAKWGIGRDTSRANLEEEDGFFASTYRDFDFGIPRLREFFSQQIKKCISEELSPDAFKDFVIRGDNDAGLYLANLGAMSLASQAVFGGQSLDTAYDSLHAQGQLNPLVPNSAAELMVATLGCDVRRIRWLPEWRNYLAEQNGITIPKVA